MRPLWSGTLSFGLVTVPVDLFPVLRSVRSPLRLISPEGHGLARQYVDEAGDVVESSEIERGYPVPGRGKGRSTNARARTGEPKKAKQQHFVLLSEQELKGLAPEKSQDINVARFVDAKAIAPMYFEHPYLLAPRGSQRAYRLLASTMEDLDKVALASFVMRDSEYVLAVRAAGGVLRADVIRFAGELRDATSVPGLESARKPPAAKVRSMKKALGSLKRKSFTPQESEDAYWEKVEKLAKEKARRQIDVVEVEAAEPESQPVADVIDLMDALKRSLRGGSSAKKRAGRARR